MKHYTHLTCTVQVAIIHLVNTMNTNATKNAICTAFVRLWTSTNYNKLTVRQICEETPVARTTFYSYYHNLDEIKQEIEDTTIAAMNKQINCIPPQNKSLRFKAATDYVMENHSIFWAFLIVQPNDSFKEKWKNCIKNNFFSHYVKTEKDASTDLLAEAIACAILGAYAFWLKHPNELTDKNLSCFIEDLTCSFSFA